MKKSLVLGVVLSLASLAFAGQKSFEVTFSNVTTVGSVKLAPGLYKLQVEGGNAVFTDSKDKKVSTAVKVESVSKKFANTAVDASKSGAVDSVNEIQLGGTTTKLGFTKHTAADNN